MDPDLLDPTHWAEAMEDWDLIDRLTKQKTRNRLAELPRSRAYLLLAEYHKHSSSHYQHSDSRDDSEHIPEQQWTMIPEGGHIKIDFPPAPGYGGRPLAYDTSQQQDCEPPPDSNSLQQDSESSFQQDWESGSDNGSDSDEQAGASFPPWPDTQDTDLPDSHYHKPTGQPTTPAGAASSFLPARGSAGTSRWN